MQNAKLAYTVEEASKSTGIGKNTLRNLIEWKKIPVIKVGRKFLIKKDVLENFLSKNEGRDLRIRNDVDIPKLIGFLNKQEQNGKYFSTAMGVKETNVNSNK